MVEIVVDSGSMDERELAERVLKYTRGVPLTPEEEAAKWKSIARANEDKLKDPARPTPSLLKRLKLLAHEGKSTGVIILIEDNEYTYLTWTEFVEKGQPLPAHVLVAQFSEFALIEETTDDLYRLNSHNLLYNYSQSWESESLEELATLWNKALGNDTPKPYTSEGLDLYGAIRDAVNDTLVKAAPKIGKTIQPRRRRSVTSVYSQITPRVTGPYHSEESDLDGPSIHII